MNFATREVERLIIDVLTEVTGLGHDRFVVRGGSVPSDGPYCVIRWSTVKFYPHPGRHYIPPENDDPEQEKQEPMVQHLEHKGYGTLRISFHRAGSFIRAVRACGHLENDNRQFDLWKDPLGFGGATQITNEFRSFNSVEMEYAWFDLDLNFAFDADYSVGWFDASRFSITQNNDGGSEPQTEEFISPDADADVSP